MRTIVNWRSADEKPVVGQRVLAVYSLGPPFTQDYAFEIVQIGKSGAVYRQHSDIAYPSCEWQYVNRWVPLSELKEPTP